MPKFRRGALKYSVDEKFFDVWTSPMAYVLGFAYADGNIYKTSLGWDIQTRDIGLLQKINKSLGSTYPITKRSRSCRLRISNQLFIKGAVKKGLLPKKCMRSELPKIPKSLIRHFVRGFLDGDGWVVLRTNRNEVNLGFSSGDSKFLEALELILADNLGIRGKVRTKIKTTPKGVRAVTKQLEYYSRNAYRLAKWLYEDLDKKDIYLKRKYKKYLLAKKLYDYLNSGTRKVRVIQKKFNKNIKEILVELQDKGLDGVEMAKELGVHSSSSYRWLARYGIKYPIRRIKNG